MLGNLQLKDVVEDKHLEKIQKFLDDNDYGKEAKCDSVKKQLGNYHIYDMPRLMVICGEEKMNNFIAFLRKENLVGEGFKGALNLSCCDLNK